jgi:hypothetical protein
VGVQWVCSGCDQLAMLEMQERMGAAGKISKHDASAGLGCMTSFANRGAGRSENEECMGPAENNERTRLSCLGRIPDASPSSQGGHEGTHLRSIWSIGMEGALGAPTPPAGLHRSARAQAGGLGGGDALDRTRRRAEERSGVHTEAALQLLASPYGLRGFL